MAKQEEKKEQPGAKKYLVVTEFRDSSNFEVIHEVGSDVSDFDADRLAKLIELGYIKA